MEGDSSSEGVSGAAGHSEEDPHPTTHHHPHLGPAGHANISAVKLDLSWPGVMSQAGIQEDTTPAGRGSGGWGKQEGGVARHLCRSMQSVGLLLQSCMQVCSEPPRNHSIASREKGYQDGGVCWFFYLPDKNVYDSQEVDWFPLTTYENIDRANKEPFRWSPVQKVWP